MPQIFSAEDVMQQNRSTFLSELLVYCLILCVPIAILLAFALFTLATEFHAGSNWMFAIAFFVVGLEVGVSCQLHFDTSLTEEQRLIVKSNRQNVRQGLAHITLIGVFVFLLSNYF